MPSLTGVSLPGLAGLTKGIYCIFYGTRLSFLTFTLCWMNEAARMNAAILKFDI